ncbi:MAG: hydrogenase/urease nickel incorporation protein HypA [Epsilonproteobacteria bacterium]|nr:hydrogenase/urease nickel incorporation protein HypA [Campylobacterota bacterium]
MHEYSIVQSLLEIIEENAKRHNARAIKKVVVKIGVLSGVEPHLLEIAFNTFKEGTICKDALLEILIQPLVVKCKECGAISEFEVKNLFFECKECKGIDLEVLDGEEMILMSLEMEE